MGIMGILWVLLAGRPNERSRVGGGSSGIPSMEVGRVSMGPLGKLKLGMGGAGEGVGGITPNGGR